MAIKYKNKKKIESFIKLKPLFNNEFASILINDWFEIHSFNT